MAKYVALLRAVNVGGTGKLPMADLKAMCDDIGLANVRTYIASGNVVFQSTLSAANVKAHLEESLEDYSGKPVGVVIRSADEMATVLAQNPFPNGAPNRVVVTFIDDALDAAALAGVTGQQSEQVSFGLGKKSGREIYVYFPDGQGNSKLKIPAAKQGTGRNMNTVAKLVEMVGE